MSDQTTGSGFAGLATYINGLFSPPVLAALRNVLSGLGLLLGMIGFGTLSPEKVQKVIELAQQLGVFIGALVAFLGIVTPLIMGAIAAFKSTQAQQVQSVKDIALGTAGPAAVSAQTALIEATAAVAQDKTIPSSKDAKDTLIAATIALPSVQTIVADKETADASPSSSVVAAEDHEVIQKIGG